MEPLSEIKTGADLCNTFFQNKEERLEHLSQGITEALRLSCCCRRFCGRVNTLGSEGRWTNESNESSGAECRHNIIAHDYIARNGSAQAL